jgi:hypothetical protein
MSMGLDIGFIATELSKDSDDIIFKQKGDTVLMEFKML